MKKFTIGISSLIAILVVIIAVAMIPRKISTTKSPFKSSPVWTSMGR